MAAADLLLLPEGAIVMVSVSVYDGRDRQASCHVEEGEGGYVGTESGCCVVQGVFTSPYCANAHCAGAGAGEMFPAWWLGLTIIV
jgi:hypothetical protein